MSDDGAANAFARFYAALVAETPADGARVVRFFDRKEFYSAHGDDADYVARTFYRVRGRSGRWSGVSRASGRRFASSRGAGASGARGGWRRDSNAARLSLETRARDGTRGGAMDRGD